MREHPKGGRVAPHTLIPDLPTLTGRLATGLDIDGGACDGRGVRVLARKIPNVMSTFPCEIVTCRWPTGYKRRVFIKHGAGRGHSSYEHRGNLPYEAEVYRGVLRRLDDFRPQYLGAHTDPETGDTSLFLEYVYRNVRLNEISKKSARSPRALAQTVRWLAQFHADHEGRSHDSSLAFLKRYDEEYYRGWADRTFEFARPLQARFPWLADLQHCNGWFAPLLSATSTVMHGEFYAKTVLVRDERIFVVDWESAAIASGAVDLAALTEGQHWTDEIVRNCETEYQRIRWPNGPPASFTQELEAARVYLHFRWLGERSDWTVREKNLWRYDRLRATAEGMGLL